MKTLEYCYQNKKITSLYFDKDDSCSHLTGYIFYYNENEILVAHITPRGEYDGFVLNRTENLYRIDYDGEYENKIEKLYKFKKQSHPILAGNEEGILYPLLDFADENKYMISLELENDTVTGLIICYDDFIYLSTVNSYGTNSGITVIDIDSVISFSVDTDNEQDLSILYKYQKD